jgi:hypothetical protein
MCWRWAFLVFVPYGLSACGCGRGEELPPLHPVTGKVVQNGKAVAGGRVEFQPVKGQGEIFINAEVGSDGRFTLATRKRSLAGPGAPEGSYNVLYLPPLPAGAADPADPARAQALKPALFPTPFKVEARDNEFVLDLGKAKK